MAQPAKTHNLTTFLWPKDIGDETHSELGDELRAYKKTATWIVGIMLLVTAGMIVVERSLTGSYATAWLVGIAGSSILAALILDRHNSRSGMPLSRTVLNVATAVAFWGSTYMNGSLLDIVNSTLDYRMIQAGSFEPSNAQFDPEQIIKALVKQSYLLPNAEHLKITTNQEIPEGTEIIGDAKKIKQILTNLLSNAVKFTNPGGEVIVNSQLATSQNTTVWQITAEDTGIGIGIEPSNLDMIFRPFTQASHGERRRFGGTGLGLALSQSIANALGGEISVKSVMGDGSKFALELPVTIANAAPTAEAVGETSIPANPRDNLSILLVEDHPLNAEIVSEVLKHLTGKEPTVVHTGEDAIAHLSDNRSVDLILMDINLGAGMSGFLAKPLYPIAMRNVLLAI